MKLIYQASNTIEAHMILNLLEQAELRARIDGDYLQGGIGELQAVGGIRVMVAENDYADAHEIFSGAAKTAADDATVAWFSRHLLN
jgi:hypothetical protein